MVLFSFIFQMSANGLFIDTSVLETKEITEFPLLQRALEKNGELDFVYYAGAGESLNLFATIMKIDGTYYAAIQNPESEKHEYAMAITDVYVEESQCGKYYNLHFTGYNRKTRKFITTQFQLDLETLINMK
jgi:hypothetical protein